MSADVGHPAARPHVVLVTLDTVRADRLGAWGHEHARTETLDGLAAAGRRYARAYAPLPLTIPSHATLFTGLLPPRHGIRSNGGGALADHHETLAEILERHGWSTAASVAAFVTTRQWGFAQGFQAYFDDVPERGGNFWHGERRADAVIDDALAWKAGQPEGRPLFLWVHLFDAHFPYAPPEGYVDPDDPRPYDGEVAWIDDQLARLVDAFEGSPTIFLVAGDHGEALGDHGESTHGLYVYESTQHVPLLISGPGIAPEVVEEPVGLVDVLPTLLDHLGLPAPAGIDGRVRPGAEAAPLYMESWQLAQRFSVAPHLAVVDGRWKLIDTPRPELYDVVADPAEAHDLAAAHPEVVVRLQAHLRGLGYGPPEAPAPADPAVALQLQSLGYVDGAQPLSGAELPDPKDHTDLVALVQRAERMQLLQRADEAEAALRELVDAYPDVVEFRSRLAALLGRAGRHDAARVELEAALRIDPHNPHLVSLRAGQLASAGRFVEAAEGFTEAALAMPYSPRLRTAAVSALRRAGRSADALRLAEEWHLQHPHDHHLAGVLGVLRVEAGRHGQAVPLLDQGLLAEPAELEVAFYRAAVEVGRGRLDAAIPLLRREYEAWPLHARAALVAARVALRVGDWEAQLHAAEHALTQVPDDPEMWHAKVLALFNLGRFPEARDAVRAGLRVDPDHPDLLLMDANLLAKAGLRDQGLRRFEEAQAALQLRREALGPGRASIHEELGVPDVQRGGLPSELPPWQQEAGHVRPEEEVP